MRVHLSPGKSDGTQQQQSGRHFQCCPITDYFPALELDHHENNH